MTPIRVLLADDHTLVRAGIRGLLEGLPGIEVAGEAGDGQEALRLTEALRPDVVVLDIGMPGLNGLEVAGRIATLDASIRDDYVSRTGGAADPLDAPTPRQREILQLAAEGHSSKEIAQRLGLSPRTVEAHRAQLMERLELHDVAGLVRFAVKVGLVTPEG